MSNKTKVKKIIGVLSDRKGFSAWWHEIGEENQKEIMLEIRRIISPESKFDTFAGNEEEE